MSNKIASQSPLLPIVFDFNFILLYYHMMNLSPIYHPLFASIIDLTTIVKIRMFAEVGLSIVAARLL
jgi:hypothetical protein